MNATQKTGELPAWMDLGEEVMAALKTGAPVVALESTIITHGMPHPTNLETALQLEAVCRDNAAVPATIAILAGRIKVGLTQSELEELADTDRAAIKTSRRDLAFVINSKANGGTTVAATMIIAALAGIRVFATGGIGGVHRGAQHSMDISADLEELARTDVAVVCAGPKSILDIGLTLEYLETHGVPDIGFQTSELPAFYTTNSGFQVDYRLDSAEEIAAAIHTRQVLGSDGGLVVANPIPADSALDAGMVDRFIDQATGEAEKRGISGKEVTPYLLQRIHELSDGASLAANIKLVLNNASLGARIANAICKQTDRTWKTHE